MIVIFEGPDGSGKDTLRAALNAEHNYRHLCLVRFFLSSIVYAEYYKKPMFTDAEQFAKFAAEFKRFLAACNALTVYTTASNKVLKHRILARGEQLAKQPDAPIIKALYWKYIKMFLPTVYLLEINTGQLSVVSAVRAISKKIDYLEAYNVH